MKATRLLAGALCAAVSLAACSSPPTPAEMEAKLKATTLKVTGSPATAAVTVTDQVETASRWIWNATVNGQAFKCDVDTFFELPACEPVTKAGV